MDVVDFLGGAHEVKCLRHYHPDRGLPLESHRKWLFCFGCPVIKSIKTRKLSFSLLVEKLIDFW